MSYRSLLVHAEANPVHVGRLRCAASLADRFGAHVVGVGAETLPPFDQGMEGAYAIVEGSWAGAVLRLDRRRCRQYELLLGLSRRPAGMALHARREEQTLPLG